MRLRPLCRSFPPPRVDSDIEPPTSPSSASVRQWQLPRMPTLTSGTVGIANLVDNVRLVREAIAIKVYTPFPFDDNGGRSTHRIIFS